MKALILAAGLGSRMAPLGQRAAKVTLPVLGRPMIRLLIDQLADQGLERAVVNIHAIPESGRAALRGAPRAKKQLSGFPPVLGEKRF